MKKLLLFLAPLLILSLGCKKNDLSTLTVEVVDYISAQPIEGADVKRGFSAGFSLSCWCSQVQAVDSFGVTNSQGQKTGLLSLDQIFVYKNGYYTAQEHYYCTHERTDYLLKFYLFKQAAIRIINDPSPTSQAFYPEPYLEAGPVLKNGTMKSFSDFNVPGIPGYTLLTPGAGDMQNRILLLRRRDGATKPDTLFKTEIFLSANTTTDVTMNY